MKIRLIDHGSEEYREMVKLRLEMLRHPIGLSFTEEQLADECDDWLVAAFGNEQLVGCCVLSHHKANTLQLRQMAVNPYSQAKGVGRKIVAYAEKLAKQKGYRFLMMHARNTALDFYKKCGYEIKGDEFTEVTIPHHHMEKKL